MQPEAGWGRSRRDPDAFFGEDSLAACGLLRRIRLEFRVLVHGVNPGIFDRHDGLFLDPFSRTVEEHVFQSRENGYVFAVAGISDPSCAHSENDRFRTVLPHLLAHQIAMVSRTKPFVHGATRKKTSLP